MNSLRRYPNDEGWRISRLRHLQWTSSGQEKRTQTTKRTTQSSKMLMRWTPISGVPLPTGSQMSWNGGGKMRKSFRESRSWRKSTWQSRQRQCQQREFSRLLGTLSIRNGRAWNLQTLTCWSFWKTIWKKSKRPWLRCRNKFEYTKMWTWIWNMNCGLKLRHSLSVFGISEIFRLLYRVLQ